MPKESCWTCKFSRRVIHKKKEDATYFCQRYPMKTDIDTGWPEILDPTVDWCGEYKEESK